MRKCVPTAAAVAGLWFVVQGPALASCGPDAGAAMKGPEGAPFTVSISAPASIPLSAPFAASITICPAGSEMPARLTVEASMPAHKHGMNYDPIVLAKDAGRYEVTGLLFHMPGHWRFEVSAYHQGKPYRFSHDVNIQ